MASKKTVIKALAMLACVFQDKQTTDEFVAVYQELLNDLPDKILLQATRRCLLHCRFFPTIAELREHAEFFKDNSEAELSKKFFNYIDGSFIPEPTDEVFYNAIDAVGGKDFLREMSNRDLLFLKKDFLKYYRDFLEKNNFSRLLLEEESSHGDN